MKIEVEVPDWAGEMALYILSGIELVARKPAGQPWQVKTSRCHYCAECCDNGKCKHLINHAQGRQCGLGLSRPFHCCVSHEGGPHCSQKFEVQS